MKKWMILMATGALAVTGLQARAESSGHRIGGGVNYWTTIDDVDVKNIDDKGFSYYFSYQYKGDLLGLEADMELMPDSYGDDVLAPQAYLLVGGDLYAAVGAGILYIDNDFANDPFFALRAGFDLELLPVLSLDIYATYRFNPDVEIKDAVDKIDTDTLFLGAAVRVNL